MVCNIVAPEHLLSAAEKAAQLTEGRQLIGEARENSQRPPATVIERIIKSALKSVRGDGDQFSAGLTPLDQQTLFDCESDPE